MQNLRSTRIELPVAELPIPDPKEDFRTYERISASLGGVREMLEEYRRNLGAVGFATLNTAMGLSKASIVYDARGGEEDVQRAQFYREDIDGLVGQFQTAVLPDRMQELLASELGHALAQVGRNQQLDMVNQEKVESELFSRIFPVLTSSDFTIEVPELPTLREFGCMPQPVIAGCEDLPLELSKQLNKYMVSHSASISPTDHIFYYGRFIAITRSICQKLEEFSGIPQSVINNSFWRGSSFSDKLHRIQMLLILHTEKQEARLFQKKVADELRRDLIPRFHTF
ncbi:MAG: hypothetical protein Q8L47_03695 [bacterium]|nr:hypothetical protein [bacterium]